jgi:hypothetical protein
MIHAHRCLWSQYVRSILSFNTVLNSYLSALWLSNHSRRYVSTSQFKTTCYLLHKSWDSSVGIATGYGLDDRGSIPGRGWALGPTQPPIQWLQGVLSLGVKRPWCEADHSPPNTAEVKVCGFVTPLPQYVFMAWCLVKHRGNFIFTYCIIIIIIFHLSQGVCFPVCLWSQRFTHHSSFRLHTVALSLLYVMLPVQLFFCRESMERFPGIVSRYFLVL